MHRLRPVSARSTDIKLMSSDSLVGEKGTLAGETAARRTWSFGARILRFTKGLPSSHSYRRLRLRTETEPIQQGGIDKKLTELIFFSRIASSHSSNTFDRCWLGLFPWPIVHTYSNVCSSSLSYQHWSINEDDEQIGKNKAKNAGANRTCAIDFSPLEKFLSFFNIESLQNDQWCTLSFPTNPYKFLRKSS